MQSMYLEACGDNAKLLEFHKQILEDDENNEAILKRQVSPCTYLHVLSKITILFSLL